MLLIMDYWVNGSLPNDDEELARIAGLSNEEWAKNRASLARMFLPEWKHKRIEEELAEAQKRSDAGRNAANKRWQSKGNADAMPPHFEPTCGTDAEPIPSQSQSQIDRDRDRERTGASAEIRTDFEEFYAAFPKHENRKGAGVRYETSRRAGVDHSRIMAGLVRWKARWVAEQTERQFIPAPDVWLNKAKYDDDFEPRAGPSASGPVVPLFKSEGRQNGTSKSPTDFLREVIRQRADDAERRDQELFGG